MKRNALNAVTTGLAGLVACLAITSACGRPESPEIGDESYDVVPCTSIEHTLGEFSDYLKSITVTNTNTGATTNDTLYYLIVGNAEATDAILFIPGTAGIIPDWDVHMITNQDHAAPGFWDHPNSTNSLCQSYALIFIDYPGVGAGSAMGSSQMYFDNLSNDIDHVLQAAKSSYLPNVTRWHVAGWSLGTLTAMRYASWSQRTQTITSLFLFGTKPGGGATGNQAGCVHDATGYYSEFMANQFTCTDHPDSTGDRLKTFLVKSLFPLDGQSGYAPACATFSTDTCEPEDPDGHPITMIQDCTDKETLKSNDLQCSTTPCESGTMCSRTLTRYMLARADGHWKDGADSVYTAERNLIPYWNLCYTVTASDGTVLESCPYLPEDNLYGVSNGGICFCQYSGTSSTTTCTGQSPYQCSEMPGVETLAVFNGFEDLWIEATFGQLVMESVSLSTIPSQKYYLPSDLLTLAKQSDVEGKSGHGTPMQYPAIYQDIIYDLVGGDPEALARYEEYRR